MSNREIKVGDVVQLNSGGPYMTVDRIVDLDGGKGADCIWFANGEAVKLNSQNFRLSALSHPNS